MAEPDFFRSFNGMCWPAQSERLGEVSWSLTWRDPPSRETCLLAASVMNAYAELIRMPAKRRNEIIRELRKGPAIVTAASGEGEKSDGL